MENAKILANLINNCYMEYGSVSENFIKKEMDDWGLSLIEKQIDVGEFSRTSETFDDVEQFETSIFNEVNGYVPVEHFGFSQEELDEMGDIERLDALTDSGYFDANQIYTIELLEKLNNIGLSFESSN